MFYFIKKLSLTFVILNVFILQSLMADMMFYYSAAILPSIIASSEEVKLKEKLAGNTLYVAIYDSIGTLESMSFDEHLATASWQEIVGGSADGNGTLTVDGMTLYYTCVYDSGEPCIVGLVEPMVFSEIVEDYMSLTMTSDVDKSKYTGRIYYDETKARTYYLDNAIKNYFVGQTKYYANENDGNGYRTYDANGTYVGLVDTTSVAGTYTIDEVQKTLSLTRSDGTHLEFTHIEYYEHGEIFALSVNGGTSFMTINYADDFLVNYFTGLRRDYENEFGNTGYRIYNKDGTFTGEVGGAQASGTYAIDKYTMVLNNSDGTVFTLTHKGSDDENGDPIQLFELDKNDGSTPFMTGHW